MVGVELLESDKRAVCDTCRYRVAKSCNSGKAIQEQLLKRKHSIYPLSSNKRDKDTERVISRKKPAIDIIVICWIPYRLGQIEYCFPVFVKAVCLTSFIFLFSRIWFGMTWCLPGKFVTRHQRSPELFRTTILHRSIWFCYFIRKGFPVQTPNFSWRELNSNLDRPKLAKVRLLSRRPT